MLKKVIMTNKSFVSIIIPCFQERDFIAKCLDSLLDNDYPRDNLEILVMDGGSTDGTKDIIKKYGKAYPSIILKDNPGRYPSSAMNKGIKESRGEIIIRCDAHACYDKDYIQRLTDWLIRDESIGNAGGIWVNKPAFNNLKAKAISYALGCSLCVGPNKYRTGITKKPIFVDTVPFGAWRREVFDKVGLFNEEFLRAQDLEFNMRLRKAGYKILLDPEIKSYYFPRSSFKKLFRMMYQCGYWKNFVNKKLKIVSSIRQFFPPVFILYLVSLLIFLPVSVLLIIPLIVYMLIVLSASLSITFKKRTPGIFPYCTAVFFLSHIGYGAGYIKGFWDIFLRRKEAAECCADITR